MLRRFTKAGADDSSDRAALRFLSHASKLFASSLDFDITLQHIKDLAVPALADFCTVELINDDGVTKATVADTSDPGLRNVSIPLIAGDRVVGSLRLCFAQSERNVAAAGPEVVQEFARRAAAALQHARLFQEIHEAQMRAEEQAIELEEQSAELEIANAELAQAEAEQRALIEAMRDIVLVLDADGRYVKIPQTDHDLLYAPSPDLIGRRMHDVMPAEAADLFLAVIREALEKKDAVSTEYSLPIDGRTFWFSGVVSPMSKDEVVWVSRDITAQREAEAAIHASEVRYRLLFESNPMPMWVYDRQSLAFLSVNDAAVQQYGYTRAEFMSMTIADIRPTEEVERLRRAVFDSQRELHSSGGWRHRRKDGTMLDVEIVAHPIDFDGHDAELILARDVTVRRQAEKELRESGEILRAVVDDSPVAIVAVDHNLNVTRWNQAAERLLGWSAEEMIGTSYLRVIPEDRAHEARRIEAILSQGGTFVDFETQRRRKDDKMLDVSVSLATLHDVQGAITGFTVVISDISKRKRIEAQLLQSQKMEAIGQLAGGVAHDFNNLLTAITSYTALLLEAIDTDDPRHADVVEIKHAADHAGALTRQLLAFSRQQVIQPETVSLNLVIGQMQKLVRRLVRENIEFDLSLDPGLGSFEADRGQIEQVLINLVVNARDAIADTGTISITTSNTNADGKAYIMLSVSDTGMGMTSEVKKHLFEPFFTTKGVGKGTGLGLATVYGIVQQAGGFVRVTSEPGQGARFDVFFPQSTAERSPAPTALPPAATLPGGGERILLVEDNSAVRTVVHRILTKLGYTIAEAATGREAVEAYERFGQSIDLLITDMVMPEMSGPELSERLRQQNPSLRVLFMSGYTKDADTDARLFGPDSDYLEKPFTPAEVARKVRALIERTSSD